MSGLTTEIIESSEALAALAPEWWDLWRRTSTPLPFLTPAWLLPWWRHFAPGRLFTLAARQHGRLVALAPAYIETGPLGRRILPLGISLSDHLDILVDAACAEPGLRALAVAAEARRCDWDVWELENLPPDAQALRLPLRSGWSAEVYQQEPCPVLMIPEGQTDLLPLLPVKKRRNIRLARNRCARRGEVCIERADERTASHILEGMIRLHGARWRDRAQHGVLASEPVLAFQREAVPELARAGLLRLYTLRIAEQVVAALYALTQGRLTYVYLSGFDPDYAFESPSVLLMAHALREALAEGCREIDFLRGGEAYKYEWGAVDRRNVKRSIRGANDG